MEESALILSILDRNLSPAPTSLDRIATSLDRIATSLDRIATSLDRIATSLDRIATSLDRIATSLDRITTSLDRITTSLDRITTSLDRIATSLDRIATSLDRIATSLDRIATSLDRIATSSDRIATSSNRIATSLKRRTSSADPESDERRSLTTARGGFGEKKEVLPRRGEAEKRRQDCGGIAMSMATNGFGSDSTEWRSRSGSGLISFSGGTPLPLCGFRQVQGRSVRDLSSGGFGALGQRALPGKASGVRIGAARFRDAMRLVAGGRSQRPGRALATQAG